MHPLNDLFLELKCLMNADLNYASLKEIVQNLARLMQLSEYRGLLDQDHWQEISNLCTLGLQVLSKSENYTTDELDVIADIFRFLRNSCGGSGKNYLYLLNSANVSEFARKPLQIFLRAEKVEEVAVLRICIQLFGNILVLNEESKPLIWQLFFKESAFKHLLCSTDPTTQEYTMMVLYNSMSDENLKELLNSKEGHDIVKTVTNILVRNCIDWGILFVECLLKREEFLPNCYSSLPLENRLLVLDIINENLKYSESEENIFIPVASIEYLKNGFLNLVKEIARLRNTNSGMEPSEFVRMLSLLCNTSVCDSYIPFLQSCKDLLGNSIETLKCVHLLGKESSNVFSSISCTKHISEKIESEPLFCFKKDLVKLIGNLCHGCKENQDLVRQFDGIPLVLDCCKLDAKNPYIMQWCILAIRNIVYGNQENQAILAGITTAEEIADLSHLKEMGINVRLKDRKLYFC